MRTFVVIVVDLFLAAFRVKMRDQFGAVDNVAFFSGSRTASPRLAHAPNAGDHADSGHPHANAARVCYNLPASFVLIVGHSKTS